MSRSEPPRRAAQQERSRRTEQRILQASIDMLSEFGEAGITMSAVSERAGVSVGSIYRRFGSRAELLIAMSDAFAQGFSRELQQRLDSADPGDLSTPEGVIRHATVSLGRLFEQNAAPLGRLLLLGLNEPAIFAKGSQASIEGGQAWMRFVLRVADDVRRPDPEAAVDYCYRLVYAVAAHRLTQGSDMESRRPLDWDHLIAELAETNMAYLLTPPRG
jgi:AcrR family transcriptional regulator